MVLFKTRNKIIAKHLNFRISGQIIELPKSVKYLGIILQHDLYWNLQLSQLIGNKAKGRISKRVFRVLCVSGGYKCLLFGKSGMLCFLETPVL